MIFLRRHKRLSLNHHECRTLLVVLLAFLCLMPSSSEATFRLCGFRLTMTLTAICKNQLCGGYFVPTKKRSETSPLQMDSSNYYEQKLEDSEMEAPSEGLTPDPTNKNNAAQTFTHYHAVSKRSGIATECCEKRCSLAYLKTYCCNGFQIAPPSSSSTN